MRRELVIEIDVATVDGSDPGDLDPEQAALALLGPIRSYVGWVAIDGAERHLSAEWGYPLDD